MDNFEEAAKNALKVFKDAMYENKINAYADIYMRWRDDPDSGDGWCEELYRDPTNGDFYINYWFEAGDGTNAFVKVDAEGNLTESSTGLDWPDDLEDLSDLIPDVDVE